MLAACKADETAETPSEANAVWRWRDAVPASPVAACERGIVMEMKWLEDFLSLVDTRNFTRSAELRFTTQPAFSRRIKSLEEWVGTTLLNRSSQPISLTSAGEKF